MDWPKGSWVAGSVRKAFRHTDGSAATWPLVCILSKGRALKVIKGVRHGQTSSNGPVYYRRMYALVDPMLMCDAM